MNRLLTLCVLAVSLLQSARCETIKEVPEFAAKFREAGLVGTFVMLDPSSGTLHVHDAARAKKRFAPASTFKIANTLIGLDCGAVTGVDEILPYGGKPQMVKEWERDMPLREAIKISNVPVYQELARRIGLERMKAGIENLSYGNRELGTVVDRFWLDGPLAISAVEQVEFLQRLAKGDLPVSGKAMATVREITLQEKTASYRLHGKTGWAISYTPAIGWYVGWVERDGDVFPFALNIDMPEIADAPKRIALVKECLRILGKVD